MGRTGSDGFAELVNEGEVSLAIALEWHLVANHYPSLPREMIPLCEKAIELANEEGDEDGKWDQHIDLPPLRTLQDGRNYITVFEAIEAFHLESFLD